MSRGQEEKAPPSWILPSGGGGTGTKVPHSACAGLRVGTVPGGHGDVKRSSGRFGCGRGLTARR